MSTLVVKQQDHLHFQTCSLHDHEMTTRCSGRLRRGGSCSHKAIHPSIAQMMPTCKVHRDQLKAMTWCRALLLCGFECKRIFEWKPHQFQYCSNHSDQKTCYFFKIPTEIRLRIYQYLLPGKDIPAKHAWFHFSDGDGEKLFKNIILVNRQIHDEAVGVLYGNRLFHIEFDGHRLSMCNIAPHHLNHQPNGPRNSVLQDYQMQLMLLEQQKKRRIMMARQEQNNLTFPSCSYTANPISSISGPIEPIWLPPISFRNFNLIQNFRIQITFVFPGAPDSATVDQKAVEAKLYDYTDHLHRLVGRLQLTEKRIRRLEVTIKFGNNPNLTKEVAFCSAEIFLRPFRRLQNIALPGVCSIMMTDSNNLEVELLPTWNLNTTGKRFAEYVACWFTHLSSDGFACADPPVYKAYWELKALLSTIKQHCYHQPRLEEFGDLLHAARVVREEDNLPQFREIWDRVVNVWFDYLAHENEFQSGVAGSIDAIYDMLNGSGKGRAMEQNPSFGNSGL